MGKRVSSHRLDNVKLEERTAVCSTCGQTQIVVLKDSKHPDWSPHLCCINRYREIVRDSQRRRREKARLQNPNWKPKHKLSEIDPQKMQAICAICGPTDILKAGTYNGQTFFRCATHIRNQARDYSRLHYQPKSRMNKIRYWWFDFIYVPIVAFWQDYEHRNDPPLPPVPCQICGGTGHKTLYCPNARKFGF